MTNYQSTPSVGYSKVDHHDGNYRSPPPPLPRLRLLSLGWIWEVLATIASVGFIAAVVVVLRSMEDKHLGNWTAQISLNATVAILITASKSLALLAVAACISQSKWILFKFSERKIYELDLFEAASRGPLGSLILLLNVRWRLGIASLGAIATIVALGVDAFAQQFISFDTQNVEIQNGTASLKLSYLYDGHAILQEQSPNIPDGMLPISIYIRHKTPMLISILASSVDTLLQGALFNGIYNITTGPAFKCDSACVWKESYISLGFTSECVDVSASTIASKKKVQTHTTWYYMTTPKNISIGA